jgi:hypothetical protein
VTSASNAVSQQQPGPELGDLLDHRGQIGIAGEHLVHLGAQPLAGRYSPRHGRGLPSSLLGGYERNLRPSSFTPGLRRDHCETARSLGARITMEPTNFQFGETQYQLEDPFGHRWTFTETHADVDPSDWGGIIPAGD